MQGECVRRIKAPKLAGTSASTIAIANTSALGNAAPSSTATSSAATDSSMPQQLAADPVPDSRPSRLHPRARALLVVEIQGLERLYAATPASAPDRPLLMRRLAEDYGELEAAASLDASKPNQSRTAIESARRVRDAASKHVLRYYRQLLDQHPTYDKLDEVYYYLAVELALLGDSAGRRTALQTLLQKFPDSKLAAAASEALGPQTGSP